MKDIYDAVVRSDIKFIKEFESTTTTAQKNRIAAAIQYRDGNGNSAVHLAAMNGKTGILNIFFSNPTGYAELALGMLVVKNAYGTDGHIPLELALLNDHLKCVASIIMHFPLAEQYLQEIRLKAMGVKPSTIKTALGFLNYAKKEGLLDGRNEPSHVSFPKDIDEQIKVIWQQIQTKILSAKKKAIELKKPLLIISAENHSGIKGMIAKFVVASVCQTQGIGNFCIEASPYGIANWLTYNEMPPFYPFTKFCLESGVTLREVDAAEVETPPQLEIDNPTDEEYSLLVKLLGEESRKRNQAMIDNIAKIAADAVLFAGALHAKDVSEGLQKVFHILTINVTQVSREELDYSELQIATERGYHFLDFMRTELEHIYHEFVYPCVIPGDETRTDRRFDHTMAYDVFSAACKDKLVTTKKSQVLPPWLEDNIRDRLKNIEKRIPEDCEIFKLIASGFQISSELNNAFQKVLVFQYAAIGTQASAVVTEYLQNDTQKNGEAEPERQPKPYASTPR